MTKSELIKGEYKIMVNSVTIGVTGAISSIFGGILAIFGIKKQIASEIKNCFKPEIEKLDTRINRLESIDVITRSEHSMICLNNEKLIGAELQNLREKMDSNQLLIIEKIDNVTEKITAYHLGGKV